MRRGPAPLSRYVAVAIAATVAVAMSIGGLVTDHVIRAEQYGAVDDFLVSSVDRPLPSPDDQPPDDAPAPSPEGAIGAFTSRVTGDIVISIVSPDGEVLTPEDGLVIPEPPANPR